VTHARELRFWPLGAAVALLLLWLLSDILLPFVVGMAVAYFFDPLVDRIQRLGLSRSWATILVVTVAALLSIAILLAILPYVVEQVSAFSQSLPARLAKISERIQPLLEPLREQLGMTATSAADLQQAIAARAGQILSWLGALLAGLLTGSLALFNLLALIFLTPVVAFYLLRDWDSILAKVDSWLPREHAELIRRLGREADAAIAGYVRGQALVCLALGLFYSVGLALVGLDFGIIIGMIAGIISIIPFVGSFTGGVMAIGMALAQFPPDWMSVALVAFVFAAGQFIEGNILAPKLVGDSVGLHPVWIMFALLAGGSLFGFVGILISVPVAAVLGVLVRHFMDRYLASAYYGGDDGGSGAPA
jgi:predicted PurR-regulated permease PerM